MLKNEFSSGENKLNKNKSNIETVEGWITKIKETKICY